MDSKILRGRSTSYRSEPHTSIHDRYCLSGDPDQMFAYVSKNHALFLHPTYVDSKSRWVRNNEIRDEFMNLINENDRWSKRPIQRIESFRSNDIEYPYISWKMPPNRTGRYFINIHKIVIAHMSRKRKK